MTVRAAADESSAHKQGLNLNNCVMHLLHRAQQAADQLFAAEFGAIGITPRQVAVLVAVGEREGTNQVGLVEATGIDRSTIADLVRRLMKKGLIARRRARHDARANVLRLTDEGRDLVDRVQAMATQVDDAVLSALPPDHRASFLESLKILSSASPSLAGAQSIAAE